MYSRYSVFVDHSSTHTLTQNYGFENICNIVSWLPESTHAIFELMFTYFLPTPPHDRVDKSHRVFNIPHYFPVHYEGEMVVDIQDCAATTLEIYRLVHEEKLPLNYVVEVCQYVYSFGEISHFNLLTS